MRQRTSAATGRFYNGFSWSQRHKAAATLKATMAAGTISPSHTCSVCAVAFARSLRMHGEDYRKPDSAYPICTRCHYAVHIRFRRPDYWRAYIAPFDPGGWFRCLSLDPASLTQPFDVTYPDGLNSPR